LADSLALDGFDNLRKAFERLGRTESRKRVSRALREASKLILDRAIENAPEKTGELKDSLTIKAMRRKKGRVGFRVTCGEGWFKGRTFYGAFQEFGTSHQPARPFIRPAYDTEKSACEQVILDGLWQAVQDAGKGDSDAD
jgi:HK97 gp10 family phage protein